jgi:tRNA pseudouridine32 synthase/23S rRNA pseudouridine746 synthase
VVPLECGGKSAFTRWRVLRRFVGSSLLLLQPRTGRSHQLRVHLAAIGHPVLGDPLYGDTLYGEPAPAPAPRLQLHAAGLQLLHPATGKPLHLRSRCFGDGLVGVDPLN